MPDLSVIVPVYNGAGFIDKTVHMILDAFGSLEGEIILINDGSTDTSGLVCAQLAREYGNVFAYDKENGGVAEARNYGLDRAKGQYVCVFDQDDSLSSSYEPSLTKLIASQADFLIANYSTDTNGRRAMVREIQETKLVSGAEKDGYAVKILGKDLVPTIPSRGIPCLTNVIWRCIFKRAFMENAGLRFFSFVDIEDDMLLLSNALLNANSVLLTDDYFYVWNIRPTSTSHSAHYVPDLTQKWDALLTWIDGRFDDLKIPKDKRLVYDKYQAQYFLYSFFLNEEARQPLRYEALASELSQVTESVKTRLDSLQEVRSRKPSWMTSRNYRYQMFICNLLLRGHTRMAHEINSHIIKRRFVGLV